MGLATVGPGKLDIDDLERLAVAAFLVGEDEQSDDAWMRAHEASLGRDDPARAATCAFWLGWNCWLRGDLARASGWLGRARTLVDDPRAECSVVGLLLIVDGLERIDEGDGRAAYDYFERARAVGERYDDHDVIALSRLGCGQALIAAGDLAGGNACLDEAMVAVVADEVSVPVAGIVYCAVLLECRNTFDARRAREWTDALSRWCAAQPDLVPYRGQCLVHRSEVLQFQGKWMDALEEARQACLRLAGHPAIGEAYYQQAEMHRLRGEYPAAETAYHSASSFGREPQPGLALLRLAQGDAASASAAIRRVAAEAHGSTARSRVLAALVEIELAVGDRAVARRAADELAAIASAVDAPVLAALARHAHGAVLLAEGDARAALPALRAAFATWQALGAPYESARERVLVAVACRRLGDEETARLELVAARTTFEVLGAAPDIAESATMVRDAAADGLLAAGLTAREAEVLRLVAKGLSNRQIAAELAVSDHTVRRHVQNIFAKVGVSSRAAATAFAYEHRLT